MSSSAGERGRARVLLALSFLGFAALGLPDGVLGVAWPSVRRTFALPLDALGALLIASTTGYIASSAVSGRIVARIGIGSLLALSCAATAVALCGYGLAGSWPVIVALGVLAGLGAGAIDAGINLYAATHHPPRTLALLHAGYGLGTTAGPAIMTTLLMADAGWRAGYRVLGAIQLALALGFATARGRWPEPQSESRHAEPAASLARTLRLRVAQLGAAGFFVYVGIEASAGAWIYSLLVGSRGLSMAAAGAAVSTYWGGLFASRVLLALAPPALGAVQILRIASTALALSAGAIALDLGPIGNTAAIAALGLAAGPIFPALISATPHRVAPAHAANAVGISVAAAAAGQALVPAGIGATADALGLEAIPRLLAVCAMLLCAIHYALEQTTSSAQRDAAALDPAAAADQSPA